MSEDQAWVTSLLEQDAAPPMPADVAARIEAAIAAEHRSRDHVDHDDEVCEELSESTNRGAYGPNAPTHYDKPGIGIVEHEHVSAEWSI